jgi:DMSO reductase anchor subunit
MRPDEPTHPVQLIPATPQTLWGKPAVANFVLGGAGAGLYVAAVAFERAVAVASWLGPALVLAGFVCVAAEAGRPLRGPRVLARARTSWMSRELAIGGAFAVLAAAELVVPVPGHRQLGALAALALALSQGLILRRARGVAAWDTPATPVVFFASSLVSGAALLILIEVGAGHPPGGVLLGSTLVLLGLGALVWLAFATWSSEEPFVSSTRALREGPMAFTIVAAGYVLPLILIALGLARPALAGEMATLAALSMLGGQVAAKAVLIVTAGQLRPITLSHLTLERSRVAPRDEERSQAASVSGHPGDEERSQAASFSGHPRIDPVSRHPIQRRLS